MRAIDADALLVALKRKEPISDSLRFMWAECLQEVSFALTIEPERKKGKWIYGESEIGNDGYYCSVCGNFVPWKYGEYDIDFIQEFLFCNKCGAKMEGAEPEDIPMEYFESGGR